MLLGQEQCPALLFEASHLTVAADPRDGLIGHLALMEQSGHPFILNVKRRLELDEPARSIIPSVLREQSIRPLAVTHSHALAVAELPPHHRDPFDRMLVSQALVHGLVIATPDEAVARYPARTIW